jgi:hypothetical protein
MRAGPTTSLEIRRGTDCCRIRAQRRKSSTSKPRTVRGLGVYKCLGEPRARHRRPSTRSDEWARGRNDESDATAFCDLVVAASAVGGYSVLMGVPRVARARLFARRCRRCPSATGRAVRLGSQTRSGSSSEIALRPFGVHRLCGTVAGHPTGDVRSGDCGLFRESASNVVPDPAGKSLPRIRSATSVLICGLAVALVGADGDDHSRLFARIADCVRGR